MLTTVTFRDNSSRSDFVPMDESSTFHYFALKPTHSNAGFTRG